MRKNPKCPGRNTPAVPKCRRLSVEEAGSRIPCQIKIFRLRKLRIVAFSVLLLIGAAAGPAAQRAEPPETEQESPPPDDPAAVRALLKNPLVRLRRGPQGNVEKAECQGPSEPGAFELRRRKALNEEQIKEKAHSSYEAAQGPARPTDIAIYPCGPRRTGLRQGPHLASRSANARHDCLRQSGHRRGVRQSSWTDSPAGPRRQARQERDRRCAGQPGAARQASNARPEWDECSRRWTEGPRQPRSSVGRPVPHARGRRRRRGPPRLSQPPARGPLRHADYRQIAAGSGEAAVRSVPERRRHAYYPPRRLRDSRGADDHQ